MNTRTATLMRAFAAARINPKEEIQNPGARHSLYRWLKRWVVRLPHQIRGEVLDRLELGRPLKREYFVGAPSPLGKIGAFSVDRPTPRSREEHRRRDARKALRRKQSQKREQNRK